MSPARSKRRSGVVHRRSRADLARGIVVGAGIVAATALLIWLVRPGPVGVPATGGLMNRQPRSSWLVGLGLGGAAFTAWWILRVSRRWRGKTKIALPIALGIVVVATVAAGFAWPGGLLRHDVAPPPPPPTTTTTSGPSTTSTTIVGGTTTTTKPGSTSTTVAGASTTTPASATTTPTTAAPATTSPPTTGSP